MPQKSLEKLYVIHSLNEYVDKKENCYNAALEHLLLSKKRDFAKDFNWYWHYEMFKLCLRDQ